jgi:FAD:protein FMN transferase
MRRQRFLGIAAAALTLGPGTARAQAVWQGIALGADCRVTLSGDWRAAEAALAKLPKLLARIEADFSLFDPGSALSRLNATGRLDSVSRDFAAVLALPDTLHRQTDGAFDPTVQALWLAYRQGTGAGDAITGWHRLSREDSVGLPPGMALTFNGIAQGYATDAVRDLLAGHGFTRALVNIGEFAALDGPWHIGIEDPEFGQLATRQLTGRALATSSPRHDGRRASAYSPPARPYPAVVISDGRSRQRSLG